MPLGKTRRRLIGAAAVIPLLVTTPVTGPLQSASAQALKPQANLNPCPEQTGKVNITFWTWEGPPSAIQHIVNEFNATHPDILSLIHISLGRRFGSSPRPSAAPAPSSPGP